MPTYSYKCTECGNAFDIQQAFSDSSLTECPSCDGALRKVFGAVGVTFNGSGFYRTDSRAAAGGKGASSGSRDTSGSGSGDAAKKPATAASGASGGSSASTASSSSSGTSGASSRPKAAPAA